MLKIWWIWKIEIWSEKLDRKSTRLNSSHNLPCKDREDDDIDTKTEWDMIKTTMYDKAHFQVTHIQEC